MNAIQTKTARYLLSTGFVLALSIVSLPGMAGGWDDEKGLDQVQFSAELVCLGCSLKKISGANAQCGLYTLHDVGIRLGDGSLWSIVNNSAGHDVIRGHELIIGKQAEIAGWMYPNANHIEIDTISIEGVSVEQLADAAWAEDQKVAKALMARSPGQAPSHDKH